MNGFTAVTAKIYGAFPLALSATSSQAMQCQRAFPLPAQPTTSRVGPKQVQPVSKQVTFRQLQPTCDDPPLSP